MIKRYSLRSSPSGCARDGLLCSSDEPPIRRLGLIPAAKAGGSQHLKFEECVRV